MSSDKPKLLLFPGIDGQSGLRQGLVECLGGRFEAQTCDLPDDPSLDYRGLAHHFAKLLPEGPLVLAGESFSGPLVAMIAETRPDKVKGVIFIASFPKLAIPRLVRHLLPFIPFRATPFWLIRWMLLGSDGPEDISDRMRMAMKLLPEKVAKRRVRLTLEIDVREIISHLPQPVLVVHGTKDRLVPYRYARQFLKARPNAQELSIDGSHMILETHPKEVAKAIETFIDSLLNSDGSDMTGR